MATAVQLSTFHVLGNNHLGKPTEPAAKYQVKMRPADEASRGNRECGDDLRTVALPKIDTHPVGDSRQVISRTPRGSGFRGRGRVPKRKVPARTDHGRNRPQSRIRQVTTVSKTTSTEPQTETAVGVNKSRKLDSSSLLSQTTAESKRSFEEVSQSEKFNNSQTDGKSSKKSKLSVADDQLER